ncbi:glycosyltransferase [Streptomyces sp. NPDC018059]|uniref:glycosyltransferase n=1 Tax=Streptomyces sp. NPDC018059 TaxID=3365041 RepID=UPI0037BA49B6
MTRILITAAGSYGDVAPCTGLGVRLREAGYDVALATHDSFAPLTEAAGLRFRGLPADAAASGRAEGRKELMRTASAFVRGLGGSLADAAVRGADLLVVSTTTAPLAWQPAEAMGIPALGAYLQPVHPARALPPVVGGTRSLGGFGNKALGRFSLRMVDRVYAEAVRDLRARLGLPEEAPGTVRARQERAGWPVLHGFSPAVVPRPADWRAGLDVVGNWWPHRDPGRALPRELDDFLEAGPPPVFIGFGSMAAGDGERLSGIAVAALRAGGRGDRTAAVPGPHRTAAVQGPHRTASRRGTAPRDERGHVGARRRGARPAAGHGGRRGPCAQGGRTVALTAGGGAPR